MFLVQLVKARLYFVSLDVTLKSDVLRLFLKIKKLGVKELHCVSYVNAYCFNETKYKALFLRIKRTV